MSVFLQRCNDGMTNLWQLFEYVAYAFATKKLRSATVNSHLWAIEFFHRVSRGFELDTTHPDLTNVLEGATRSHADAGNQATVRRPVSWAMLLAGETLIPVWRNWGRVLRLALCVSSSFLTRASKMFARVENVCGDSVAHSRDVMLAAGGRGFLSRTGPAHCGGLVDR